MTSVADGVLVFAGVFITGMLLFAFFFGPPFIDARVAVGDTEASVAVAGVDAPDPLKRPSRSKGAERIESAHFRAGAPACKTLRK